MNDKKNKNKKKTLVKITVGRTRRTASPIRTAIYTYTLALAMHNGWVGGRGKTGQARRIETGLAAMQNRHQACPRGGGWTSRVEHVD